MTKEKQVPFPHTGILSQQNRKDLPGVEWVCLTRSLACEFIIVDDHYHQILSSV